MGFAQSICSWSFWDVSLYKANGARGWRFAIARTWPSIATPMGPPAFFVSSDSVWCTGCGAFRIPQIKRTEGAERKVRRRGFVLGRTVGRTGAGKEQGQ